MAQEYQTYVGDEAETWWQIRRRWLIDESRREQQNYTGKKWRFAKKSWANDNKTKFHRIRTRSARSTWEEFLHVTGLGFAELVILLDFHHVIDSLWTSEEASNLLLIMDRLRAEDVKIVGCSHGTDHMEKIFAGTAVYKEVVTAVDGWIFTKERWWDEKQGVSRIRRTKRYPQCKYKK